MKPNIRHVAWLVILCNGMLRSHVAHGAPSLNELLNKLNLNENGTKAETQDASEWHAMITQVTELARQTSNDLRFASSKTDVAIAQKDVASAGFYPSASVNAQVEQSRATDSKAETEVSALQRQINLVLRQNLFNGGNDKRLVQSADRQIATAKDQERMAQAQLDYQVASALLDYHDAILRKDIAEIILAETDQLESVINKKQAAGRAGRIDVEQTKMQQIETRTQAVEIDTEIEGKRKALSTLLGNSANAQQMSDALVTKLTKMRHPEVSAPSNLNASLTTLQQGTIRDQVLRRQIEQAESDLRTSEASRWYPNVDAVASGSLARNDSTTKLDDFRTTSTSRSDPRLAFGLEASWTLWNAKLHHDVRRADRSLVSQNAELASFASQFEMNITQLRVQLQKQLENLPVYRDYFTTANRLYQAQVALYKAGNAEISDVLNTNIQRLNALRNWERQIYQYRLNWFRWRFVTIVGEQVK